MIRIIAYNNNQWYLDAERGCIFALRLATKVIEDLVVDQKIQNPPKIYREYYIGNPPESNTPEWQEFNLVLEAAVHLGLVRRICMYAVTDQTKKMAKKK